MTGIPINEVFDTLQGEATHTGTPATFLRLQGCNVGCPWCDTKNTWLTDDANRIDRLDMERKTGSDAKFAVMPVDELVAMLALRVPQAVVITGGEPCDHDLLPLTSALLRIKRLVQIETSGTAIVRADPKAWVTVSPKVGMPGGLPVLMQAVVRADEIKWPVGSPRDVDALLAFLVEYRVGRDMPIWMQPLSRSQKATDLCISQATKNGFRVSIQTHAFIGIR